MAFILCFDCRRAFAAVAREGCWFIRLYNNGGLYCCGDRISIKSYSNWHIEFLIARYKKKYMILQGRHFLLSPFMKNGVLKAVYYRIILLACHCINMVYLKQRVKEWILLVFD